MLLRPFRKKQNCEKDYQWLISSSWWFSPNTPVSSNNRTDCRDISKILLKVALKSNSCKVKVSSIWVPIICKCYFINTIIYNILLVACWYLYCPWISNYQIPLTSLTRATFERVFPARTWIPNTKCHGLIMLHYLRREVIVRFVVFGEIVDHYCLICFVFIIRLLTIIYWVPLWNFHIISLFPTFCPKHLKWVVLYQSVITSLYFNNIDFALNSVLWLCGCSWSAVLYIN